MTDVQTTADAEIRTEEPARPATSRRRVVLLGVGALGATTALAACGTGSSGGNTDGAGFTNNPAPAGSKAAEGGNGNSGNSGDSGGSSGGAVLAAVADIPKGGGKIVGDYVITQPTDGTFKAFSKVCTHQGCDVGKVADGVINCPCHNSNFSIETGAPTSGPAKKPLPETQIKVDGDNIVAA